MIRSFSFIVFSVLLLTGCGVRGGLDVPPPLFGEAKGPPPPVPEIYERNDTRRGDAATLEASLPSGERVDSAPETAEDPFAPEETPDGDGDS